MSALDIIGIVCECVNILGVTVAIGFVGVSAFCIPLIVHELKNIDGALRCIDIDLADFLRDERKKWGDKE